MPNPATSFEPHRQHLLGLAYRMLGSMADAQDAVQETYLRWHAADGDRVLDPRAFLMTTTTRICLDMLTSARARREEYVGPWLPEPVVDTAGSRLMAARNWLRIFHRAALDPRPAVAARARSLPATRRVRFLVQRIPHGTGAERGGVGSLPPARATRPRGATSPPARSGGIGAKHALLMYAFAAATQSGDLNAPTHLLADDVRVVTLTHHQASGFSTIAHEENVLDSKNP